MASPFLMTYQDAVDHLRAHNQSSPISREETDILHAIQSGYNEIFQVHDWRYYLVRGRITLQASYATGTVVYTHTGGTSERQLALTTGTWPSWAARGHVILDSIVYTVATRVDDNNITLDTNSNPGADVASTTYTIYQNTYPLPADFLSIDELHLEAGNWGMQDARPGYMQGLETHVSAADTPRFYSIISDPDAYSGYAIYVYPYPSTDEELSFFYRRAARELRYPGRVHSTIGGGGTVAGTTGTATITGTSTAFTSAMVGSVFRALDTTDDPTGLGGLTPYGAQHIISAVASTTSLTLSTNLTATLASTTKYSISDPVDIPGHMRNAFLRACEWQLALAREPDSVNNKHSQWVMACRQAMEQDSLIRTTKNIRDQAPLTLRGWDTDLGANNG